MKRLFLPKLAFFYAEEMTLGEYNDLKNWTIPANEDPKSEGFLVYREDGSTTWSPKELFLSLNDEAVHSDSVVEQEVKEPTFGELAVGLSFNPSNLSDVDKVKRAFADLIDMCNKVSTFTYLGNTLKVMAIRACIEAQMGVVKLITFKEK